MLGLKTQKALSCGRSPLLHHHYHYRPHYTGQGQTAGGSRPCHIFNNSFYMARNAQVRADPL